MRTTLFHGVATFCLLAAGALEAHHSFGLGRPWPGLGAGFQALSWVLLAFWAIGIAGVWTRRAFSDFAVTLALFLVLSQGLLLAMGLADAPVRTPSLLFAALALAGAGATFAARMPERRSVPAGTSGRPYTHESAPQPRVA